jgi:general secretion pathway protein K
MTLIGGPQYDVMFDSRDEDGNYHHRATVCGALVDWVDPDQDQYVCQEDGNAVHAGSVAGEDSYYARLKRPYERKNAAFDSLQELHLVRGVNEDFWRTFIQADPDDPAARNVTVWGSGKVNINTANAHVIWQLVCSQAVNPESEPFCTDPTQLATFIGVMQAKEMFTRGIPLFTSPKAFIKVILGKGGGLAKMILIDLFQLTPISQVKSEAYLLDKLSSDSKVFSIYATGVAHSGKRETRVRIHTVVDFRQAPPPGQNRNLADIMDMVGMDSTASQATDTKTKADDPLADLPEEALLDALQKDPGGNVVYFRLD